MNVEPNSLRRGRHVMFLKVGSFLEDQRLYMTYRRTVPISFLASESHPVEREFQVAAKLGYRPTRRDSTSLVKDPIPRW